MIGQVIGGKNHKRSTMNISRQLMGTVIDVIVNSIACESTEQYCHMIWSLHLSLSIGIKTNFYYMKKCTLLTFNFESCEYKVQFEILPQY